jgi:hypothetical protein
MSSFPNLSEIVGITLRNRSATLAKGVMANNALLKKLLDPWQMQAPGSMRLPDFIKMRAQGRAKMENGRVYVLKDKEV